MIEAVANLAKPAALLILGLMTAITGVVAWVANQVADMPDVMTWMLGPLGLLVAQTAAVVYLVKRSEEDRHSLMEILREQTQINAECRDVMRDHARLTEANNKVLADVKRVIE